jgi:hypothetical protein
MMRGTVAMVRVRVDLGQGWKHRDVAADKTPRGVQDTYGEQAGGKLGQIAVTLFGLTGNSGRHLFDRE